MSKRVRMTPKGVRKMRERERLVGIDPSDAAAKWLKARDGTTDSPGQSPPRSEKLIAVARGQHGRPRRIKARSPARLILGDTTVRGVSVATPDIGPS